MTALFCELYFCCLGKRSQTETGFKMNFLPVKGENSNHILLCFDIQTGKNTMASERSISFLKHRIQTFHGWWQQKLLMTRMMDGCLSWINLGGEEWNLSQSDGDTAKFNCWTVSIFVQFFLSHTNFPPLRPTITWGRGNNSLWIIWYGKG